MTIFEYISNQFTSLGLVLNEADCLSVDLWDTQVDLTPENKDEVDVAMTMLIPSLLLRPTSVSEGGVSITRAQRSDIEAYYAIQCRRLGLKNILSPRIKFR